MATTRQNYITKAAPYEHRHQKWKAFLQAEEKHLKTGIDMQAQGGGNIMIRFIWNGNTMFLNPDLISSFEVRKNKTKVTMSNGDFWEWSGEESQEALKILTLHVVIRNPRRE